MNNVLKLNSVVLGDCMDIMAKMPSKSVDMVLTDIPYGSCNKASNGLRQLDKSKANVETFDLQDFLTEVERVTRGTILLFCGMEQFSTIYKFFADKQKKKQGTVRGICWSKTNPSPMNGQHIYLSGMELAVWYKPRGAVFNAKCKSNVFTYPCGRSKLHPTEKNHQLLTDLILDNTNPDDIIFDPCAGSGSHLLCARDVGRKYFGIEIDNEYFKVAENRMAA